MDFFFLREYYGKQDFIFPIVTSQVASTIIMDRESRWKRIAVVFLKKKKKKEWNWNSPQVLIFPSKSRLKSKTHFGKRRKSIIEPPKTNTNQCKKIMLQGQFGNKPDDEATPAVAVSLQLPPLSRNQRNHLLLPFFFFSSLSQIVLQRNYPKNGSPSRKQPTLL